MEVTIESVLKNKQIYNGNIEKIKLDRSQLMQQVIELRKNKRNMSNETDIARNEFEEAKLVQQINNLTNTYKSNKLTLEQLELQQEILELKIDQETYTKGSVANREAKKDLDDYANLEYCEYQVEMCKKALKLYTLENDVENVGKWEKALNKALDQLKDAQEIVNQKEEQKEEKREEQKEQDTEPYINENGEIIRPGNTENSTRGETTPVDPKKLHNESTANLDPQYIVESDNYEGKHKIYYEERGNTTFLEKEEYGVYDDFGNEIGYSKYTEITQLEKGVHSIETSTELENEDGRYIISSKTNQNSNGSTYIRNVKGYNKRTDRDEQITYTIDEQGNEFVCSQIDGKTAYRVSKTSRGTVIEKYDENGQIMDSYEYDKDGKAILGFKNMDEIPENYVEEFARRMEQSIPQYYQEPVDIGTHESKQSILKSAEEAINENTRTGKVNEQAKTMKAREQEREQAKINPGRETNNPDIEKN